MKHALAHLVRSNLRDFLTRLLSLSPGPMDPVQAPSQSADGVSSRPRYRVRGIFAPVGARHWMWDAQGKYRDCVNRRLRGGLLNESIVREAIKAFVLCYRAWNRGSARQIGSRTRARAVRDRGATLW